MGLSVRHRILVPLTGLFLFLQVALADMQARINRVALHLPRPSPLNNERDQAQWVVTWAPPSLPERQT